MKTSFKLMVASIGIAALSTASQASVITLFNTGVNSTGNPLPNGSTDSHYTITSAPGGTLQNRVLTSVGGYPIGPWLPDDSTSAWIGPDNDTQADGPAGIYTYRTTFDLTGLNSASAVIKGQWSMDDGSPWGNIVLNGNATGNLGISYGAWDPFALSSGFVAGINTLDFVVYNYGGPTGLRVEMEGTASPVPEPSTIFAGAMLLLPLGASALRKIRAKK